MSSVEPYTLSLEATWQLEEPQINRWIKGATFVRAERATITITITNTGNNNFIGGKITKLRFLVYGSSFGNLSMARDMLSQIQAEIPALKPKTSHSFKLDYIPEIEGAGWTEIAIASADNIPVKLLENYPLSEGGFSFQVVSRELILLLDKLDKLLNK